MAGRPAKRKIVRWNDDHDKELLLWITHVCAESGIKIPYDKVAYYMGPDFSEGAVTQHLAKIRIKAEEAGLHVPTPSKKIALARPRPAAPSRRKRSSAAKTEPLLLPGEEVNSHRRKRPRQDSVHQYQVKPQPKEEPTDDSMKLMKDETNDAGAKMMHQSSLHNANVWGARTHHLGLPMVDSEDEEDESGHFVRPHAVFDVQNAPLIGSFDRTDVNHGPDQDFTSPPGYAGRSQTFSMLGPLPYTLEMNNYPEGSSQSSSRINSLDSGSSIGPYRPFTDCFPGFEGFKNHHENAAMAHICPSADNWTPDASGFLGMHNLGYGQSAYSANLQSQQAADTNPQQFSQLGQNGEPQSAFDMFINDDTSLMQLPDLKQGHWTDY